MMIIYGIFGVLFGLCLGSFANVLVYRLPKGISFTRGTSQCPACGRRIEPRDLLPVISYLLLRGRCRFCDIKISVRYPLIELAGGLLGLIAIYRYGYNPEGFIYLGFFITLLVIALIDAEHMIIPDGLVVALLVLALPLMIMHRDNPLWYWRVAGFFALSLPMLITNVFVKEAFGGGDIKLMAVCGLLLGLGPVLVAGFIGILTAGIRAMALILSGKPYKNVHMPFGPYLCFGVWVACLYGPALVAWYLNLLF